MAKVELKKIEKIYPNGFKAVHGVDLDIKDGEFIVFVGPSGCSKSTLLRMIAGLEKVTNGEIIIGDKVVNDVAAKDRGIAFVFQNYALYPHMTVYENMAFGLKLRKTPKDEIDQRVREAAEMLEITQLLDRKPKEMSGGQRQRVAVGRAIVRHPDIFLFDEPLSNLDAKLRVHMRIQILELHQSLKKRGVSATMIYVTHDQVEAMTMGDRICVLKSGEIQQVDTPLNLYYYPVNKFVATFIGSPAMNMLEAYLEKDGELIRVNIKGSSFILGKEKSDKIMQHAGKKVWFGIRPENILTRYERPKEMVNRMFGEVKVIEQMGNEMLVHFLDENNNEFITRVESRSAPDLKNGVNYEFYFEANKCHIFDFDNEKNISL